jgi:uncharacterized damage-inducible protein DinB
MNISEALIPEFDQEMATTRRVLERVPEVKYGWKPHEKSMTAGRLASHICEMGMWASMTMTTGEFDFNPGGKQAFPAFNAASKTELLAEFDKQTANGRAALAAASNEEYMKNWALKNNGQVLFTMPKVVVIRSFVFNHIVHHRGQLSVYLRLLDVPVPSIYGPSADEGQM